MVPTSPRTSESFYCPVDRDRLWQLLQEVFPGQVWKRPSTSRTLLYIHLTWALWDQGLCLVHRSVHRLKCGPWPCLSTGGGKWQWAVAWRCKGAWMNTGHLCLTRPLAGILSFLLILKCEYVSSSASALFSLSHSPLSISFPSPTSGMMCLCWVQPMETTPVSTSLRRRPVNLRPFQISSCISVSRPALSSLTSCPTIHSFTQQIFMESYLGPVSLRGNFF